MGLRFKGHEAIFGFTPDTALKDDTPTLVSELLEGKRFKGRVADDFEDFEDAARSPYGRSD